MQAWKEQDHPRDDDGKFTEKEGTAGAVDPRKIAYRQNTPYQKILADDRAREKSEESPLDWQPIRRKPMGERLKGHDSYIGDIAGVAKGAPMSFAKADGHRCNPMYGTQEGYSRNCQTCTAVYLARLHGYHVEALPCGGNLYIDLLAKHPIDIYIDEDGRSPSPISKHDGQSIADFLDKKTKPGRLYAMTYLHKNRNGGHILTVDKMGGKFRAYDPQTGMTFNLQDFSDELKEQNTSGHTLYDITDCKVDEGYANKIMRKVKTDEQ